MEKSKRSMIDGKTLHGEIKTLHDQKSFSHVLARQAARKKWYNTHVNLKDEIAAELKHG